MSRCGYLHRPDTICLGRVSICKRNSLSGEGFCNRNLPLCVYYLVALNFNDQTESLPDTKYLSVWSRVTGNDRLFIAKY